MTAKWDLLESTAACQLGEWSFELQPTNPTNYATFRSGDRHWEAVAIKPLPRHAMVTEEAYVRGNDFIVRFSQAEHDEYAFQLNWRILGGEGGLAAGIELWLSIQTTLLDSSPELEVLSDGGAHKWQIFTHGELIGGEETGRRGSSTAALLLSDSEATQLWLIEPSDQVHAERLSSSSEAIQRVKLFDHFMEKGVIRRARMRFWVGPGEIDFAQIQKAYQDFAASALPLTA